MGCGQGDPTLELAKLSNGEIIAMDIHQPSLDELQTRIGKEGLFDRIRLVMGSMFEIDFPDESFDIIWAKGAIHVVGFERGLKEWPRLIKSDGFLVVHEMIWLRPEPPQEIVDRWRKVYPGIRTAAEYIEQVPLCGCELVGDFSLPEETWWLGYYGPLQERIRELREKNAEEKEAQKALDGEQREVDLYKTHSKWYGSAFFVMRKSR